MNNKIYAWVFCNIAVNVNLSAGFVGENVLVFVPFFSFAYLLAKISRLQSTDIRKAIEL